MYKQLTGIKYNALPTTRYTSIPTKCRMFFKTIMEIRELTTSPFRYLSILRNILKCRQYVLQNI